jgi:hemerythrin superfamily protein
MDALELLKSDHQRISDLFDQFKNTNGLQGQKEIYRSIHRELSVHSHMEETTFYPAFRNYPEFNALITQSFDDHRKLKALLEEIRSIRDPGQFQSKVHELMDSVLSHVQVEENELFPKVRQLMKRPERETLGRHLQAARDERLEAAA